MIDADNIVIGGMYRIIKCPPLFPPDFASIGEIGICRWANYRGACLKFPNGHGYVVPFDCVEDLNSVKTEVKKPKTFRTIPTKETAVVNQYRYRFSKLDKDIGTIPFLGLIGRLCAITWVDSPICEICFESGESKVVYLTCLEDTES